MAADIHPAVPSFLHSPPHPSPPLHGSLTTPLYPLPHALALPLTRQLSAVPSSSLPLVPNLQPFLYAMFIVSRAPFISLCLAP